MTYDTFLPILDLAQFADDARKLMGYKMFYAGIGIIGLGLVAKSTHNVMRVVFYSERPNFVQPILTAAFFFALLASYKVFVASTIYLVSRLGLTTQWSDNVVTTFVARFNTYMRWRAEYGSYKTYAMEFLVGLLYLLVEGCVVFWRASQTFMLAVIVTYGPILLGVASLGGFLLPVGISWFWALVQVSMWSVTMDNVLLGFSRMKHVVKLEDISLNEEFLFSLVMFGLLGGIPGVTSFLLRGSEGSITASGHSMALRTSGTIATSRLSQNINKAVYDGIKGGLRGLRSESSSKSKGGTEGGTGDKAQESAWKGADAIATHRESRATSSRAQEGKAT
jgi:hypothetical protein